MAKTSYITFNWYRSTVTSEAQNKLILTLHLESRGCSEDGRPSRPQPSMSLIWPRLFTFLLLGTGPLSLPRSAQSPSEPRNKRLRRLSSTEEDLDLGGGREKGPGGEVTYYGQSPASLSSQTSWHSDVDHG